MGNVGTPDVRTRRRVLSGLGAATGSLLGGCLDDGRRTRSPAVELGFDHIGLFEPAANDLEAAFEDREGTVTVDARATSGGTAAIYDHFVNKFVAEAADFDVGMMDVVWPAEFVANEWLSPIDSDPAVVDGMLPTPVEAATVDGTLYGIPIFTDTNALYYRRDLLESAGYDAPPKTFSELIAVATDIVDSAEGELNGYVWSGAPNEGLTAEWHSWLWGLGGSVWDDGTLRVDSPEGIQALQHAVDLVYEHGITPEAVVDSSIDLTRQTFEQGNTVFMRNWTYAYQRMQDDTPVTDAFAVAPMPSHESAPEVNCSCLGGRNAGVNAFSTDRRSAVAFAAWLGSLPAQEIVTDHGWFPVRRELYAEEYWRHDGTGKPAPLAAFEDIIAEARSRPTLSDYSRYSSIVAGACHAALRRAKTPAEALEDAQREIEDDVTV